MAEPLVDTLERWALHGAQWKIVHLSDALAVVDLCTCFGEPVERLESRDQAVIDYLRAHPPE